MSERFSWKNKTGRKIAAEINPRSKYQSVNTDTSAEPNKGFPFIFSHSLKFSSIRKGIHSFFTFHKFEFFVLSLKLKMVAD